MLVSMVECENIGVKRTSELCEYKQWSTRMCKYTKDIHLMPVERDGIHMSCHTQAWQYKLKLQLTKAYTVKDLTLGDV